MKNSDRLLSHNNHANESSTSVSVAMDKMLLLVSEQLQEISNASGTATDMKKMMEQVVQQARSQFESVRTGTQSIRDVVDNSARTIHTLRAAAYMETSVAGVDRSLRLAEEASSDNSPLHAIVERMFNTIHHIDQNSQQHGEQVRELSSANNTMSKVVRALQTSSDRLKNTATKLHQLAGEFQVSSR